MKVLGKILFFNANDGQGIIITSKKEKINFNVAAWDDFDTMPSLGLEVNFIYEDSIVSSIVSVNYIDEEDEAEPPKNHEIENPPELPPENLIEEPIKEEKIEENSELNSEEEKPQSENIENNFEEDNEDLEKEDVEDNDEAGEENGAEHFDADAELAELGTNEDLVEELGEREESVTITINLPMAVNNYFNIIKENIDKRTSYKKVDGRLDYLLIRRFLWTAFNNLSEIDLHIVTPTIRSLSEDLKAMASVYDDFAKKTKYPKFAYEEVFLSCQAEYNKIKDGSEKTIERLNLLRGNEKIIGGVLKVKKEELSAEIKSEEFDVLQDELKSLNGTYVDIVHMMAELDERYKHDMQLLVEFEREYKEEFYDLFTEAAKKYRVDIVTILSAQAFVLDSNLWQQAKSSKAVRAHFHKSGISGEFNTKTYLKFFLSSQDSTKASADNKKLFELYDYLVAHEKEHIMIVMSDVTDALEHEATIKKLDKGYDVKAFIDEKLALKWAMKHSVKVLILENELAKMQVTSFLTYYRKYILVIPKIILLGNTKNSDSYTISKLLARNVSSRVIAQNVQELLSSVRENE